MKDNTLMAILSTALILAIGTCATMDTYMQYKTKPPIIQTVTNTIIESTASAVALRLTMEQVEVSKKLIDLNNSMVDRLIAVGRRLERVEQKLEQPPKTIVEGATNLYIGLAITYTNVVPRYFFNNSANETH